MPAPVKQSPAPTPVQAIRDALGRVSEMGRDALIDPVSIEDEFHLVAALRTAGKAIADAPGPFDPDTCKLLNKARTMIEGALQGYGDHLEFDPDPDSPINPATPWRLAEETVRGFGAIRDRIVPGPDSGPDVTLDRALIEALIQGAWGGELDLAFLLDRRRPEGLNLAKWQAFKAFVEVARRDPSLYDPEGNYHDKPIYQHIGKSNAYSDKEPPKYEAWSKYVRDCRNYFGMKKNNFRRGRTGKSLISKSGCRATDLDRPSQGRRPIHRSDWERHEEF